MRVALLTAGGLAPCLSTAVADLIEEYQKKSPKTEIFAYLDGYAGLLTGNLKKFEPKHIKEIAILKKLGGSPIGNSRVKLTNDKDLLKRGFIKTGQTGLKKAADQLTKDKIDVLHTIGGDDTNTTAADLAAYLKENNYSLQVVGLPKTVDNDIYPVLQSFGADSAASYAASYAENYLSEHTAADKVLVVHEVMGRHSGWLTAQSAKKYLDNLKTRKFLGDPFDSKEKWSIHGIYVPEIKTNWAQEGKRLKKILNKNGNVNIFVAEGAVDEKILKEAGVAQDAFGHYKLDEANPGQIVGEKIAKLIGAEKIVVQKSGYYSRSGASNKFDLQLIQKAAVKAVDSALKGLSGLVGQDDNSDHFFKKNPDVSKISLIDFERIKGGKPLDINAKWFKDTLKLIEQ